MLNIIQKQKEIMLTMHSPEASSASTVTLASNAIISENSENHINISAKKSNESAGGETERAKIKQ
jgi:hypothetical protein